MINFRLIRHLWLFLAVAEERNFGKAATRLGMSQPPLTKQIQVLEQALKVKLFVRSGRGAHLTPVGSAILPAVQKLADQLQRLELAVQEAVAGQTGLLTIGVIRSAMNPPLSRVIAQFRKQRPDVTVSVVELDSAGALRALEAGDIDVAFARLEGDLGSSVRSVVLLEERLAVALPSGHPLCDRDVVDLLELRDEDFVMVSRQVSPVSYDGLIAECRGAGFSPRVLHEVRSLSSQLAFVDYGQGVALVPLSSAAAAGENVVVKPLSGDTSIVSTAMAWNSAIANPLVDILREITREQGVAQSVPRDRAEALLL